MSFCQLLNTVIFTIQCRGVAPALTPARGYASRPAAARRFLGEEVCDAPQLAAEVVGACMENVPDRPCCRAIAAVVDFGCFCPVAESSVIFSNGTTPPVILTLYVECRGTKNRNIYSLWTDIKYLSVASLPPPPSPPPSPTPPPPPTTPPPSRSDTR
uniref:Bifunctional inhibitor/plant lipid transfer protein/seed storage helical domain-containing protein n=1 Tax=Oryza glaberrima TaxID=4538 RepID=I1QBI6_ORYGL